MFSVSIDMSRFKAAVKAATAQLPRNMSELVQAATEGEMQSLKSSHPYKDRSGALTASLSTKMVQTSPRRMIAALRAKASHASYVEFGTQPHIIQPKHVKGGKVGSVAWSKPSVNRGGTRTNTKHLKGWTWTSNQRTRKEGAAKPMLCFFSKGRWVRVPFVHHPGTKPLWFMTQAARNSAFHVVDGLPTVFSTWARMISRA